MKYDIPGLRAEIIALELERDDKLEALREGPIADEIERLEERIEELEGQISGIQWEIQELQDQQAGRAGGRTAIEEEYDAKISAAKDRLRVALEKTCGPQPPVRPFQLGLDAFYVS